MARRAETADPEIRAEKTRRLAVGATIAGVLLILFLVVVLIIQFVKIANANAEKRALQADIERWEQLSEDEKKNLEYYLSEMGLYQLAIEAGWKNPKS